MRGYRGGWRRSAAAAAVLALAVGCSSSSSGGDGATDPGPTGSVVPGGTLTVAIAEPETSLDLLDFKTSSFNILDQIYEPLVRYGNDGSIQPGLAEKYEVSSDGLTLTFTLRQGVTFSDGEPFTAAVAKADVDRWIFDKKFNFLGISTRTKSVTAPDARTLVITLTEPYRPALQELALARPVRFPSPKAYGSDGGVAKPIGTGPYKFDSLSPTAVTLTRNDSYWGGRPNLDKVVFTVIPDADARQTALKAGEVQLVGGQYMSPLSEAQATELKSDSNVRVLTQPSATNLLLAFNATSGNPALQDPKVREAINRALDREGYAKALFSGLAEPATEIFPTAIPDAPSTPRSIPLDGSASEKLLDEAGWSGSGTRAKGGKQLTLRLLIDPNFLPQAKSLAEAVQADLERVGIAVEVKPLDSTAYIDRQSAKDYDMVFYTTYGPPYDPFAMLNDNFVSTSESGLYGTPAIDKLINAAFTATSAEESKQSYAKVWTALDDAWAVAPLVELSRVWAVSSKVQGFALGATEYDLPLQRVGLTG